MGLLPGFKGISIGDRDPAGVITHVYDITETKLAVQEKNALEAHLQQTHKIEAIAHDFNNLLTNISDYSAKISEKETKKLVVREFCLKPMNIKEIATAVRKALDVGLSDPWSS